MGILENNVIKALEPIIKEIPGSGHMSNIKELVEQWNKAIESQDEALVIDEVEEEIRNMPLCVEVKNDWHDVNSHDEYRYPTHYKLLLGTGGPAVQIVGELNEHGEPETAELQGQDWFTPWERTKEQDEDILLQFARFFYFR